MRMMNEFEAGCPTLAAHLFLRLGWEALQMELGECE